MVPSVLPQAWRGLVHASFGFGGEEFISGDADMLQNLVLYPSDARGLPVASPARCFSRDARLSPARQTRPPLSQRQPLLGTPLVRSRGCSLFSLPGTFCVCRVTRSCTQRCFSHSSQWQRWWLQIPLSSRGINASTTERQGDAAVLNVSLPASAFSLTS